MVLQRFSRASRRWGSSFRNFTASTSTLSTTRILLWRLGNWSAQGGEERGISENRKLCVRERCRNVDVRRNRAGEQGRREEADYREGDIKGRRDAVSVSQDFPVISRWFLWGGLSGGQLNEKDMLACWNIWDVGFQQKWRRLRGVSWAMSSYLYINFFNMYRYCSVVFICPVWVCVGNKLYTPQILTLLLLFFIIKEMQKRQSRSPPMSG